MDALREAAKKVSHLRSGSREGGGGGGGMGGLGKALMAGPLVDELFLRLPLDIHELYQDT